MITPLLLVRARYMYCVVLHAHPVHGESRSQHNVNREIVIRPIRTRKRMTSAQPHPVHKYYRANLNLVINWRTYTWIDRKKYSYWCFGPAFSTWVTNVGKQFSFKIVYKVIKKFLRLWPVGLLVFDQRCLGFCCVTLCFLKRIDLC